MMGRKWWCGETTLGAKATGKMARERSEHHRYGLLTAGRDTNNKPFCGAADGRSPSLRNREKREYVVAVTSTDLPCRTHLTINIIGF